VGVIEAVGRDVWHLRLGQRVVGVAAFVAGDNIEDPAQILIGLAAMGAGTAAMPADWRDGTLAEFALARAATVTPAEGLDTVAAAQLAVLNRAIVPYGGLLRGRLAAGETLLVNGATGAYGTAAVLLGVALGAARVVAAGRNALALAALANVAGRRLVPVRLSGDLQADVTSLRAAAGGGGAEIAFDMVGQAEDANATLAPLHSLRRGGRPVLMGSMTTPLPLPYGEVIRNNWKMIGQFMYPAHAYRSLLSVLRAGLLDISAIRSRRFPLAALPEAIDAAATATSLECVAVEP
jgi:alcohol dehydrogenase